MKTFYRWIASPEIAELRNSNHGLTTINVHPERVEELKALGRVAGEEFELSPEALIIPLEVFESFETFDGGFDGEGNYIPAVEVEVIPELEGVCCFEDLEAALSYGGEADNYMMVFEGERCGNVWDGDLAQVETIVEIVPSGEFFARHEGVAA